MYKLDKSNRINFPYWFFEVRPFQSVRSLLGFTSWLTMFFAFLVITMMFGFNHIATWWIGGLLGYFTYMDFKQFRRETGLRW